MKLKYSPFILIGLGIILMALFMYPWVHDILAMFLLVLALMCGLITLGSGIALVRK